MLRYFNFEPSFKLQWCYARDLFGSQITVTTGGFEPQISCIQRSYLTHQAIRPRRLGGFGVPEFVTLGQEQLIYVEILQLRAKFQIRVLRISLTYQVLQPIGLGKYFACKKFTVQNLLWSLEFVIQINLEHNTIADSYKSSID